MIDQTLNYIDNDGNTVTAPTIDISNDSMTIFQTHCKSCGAPSFSCLNTVKLA